MFFICIFSFFLTSQAASPQPLIFTRYYLGEITPLQNGYGCKNRFIEVYNPTDSAIHIDQDHYFLFFGTDPSTFVNNQKSLAVPLFNSHGSQYIEPKETHLIADKNSETGFININDVKQTRNFDKSKWTLTNSSVVGLMWISDWSNDGSNGRVLLDVLGYKNTNGWTKNRTFLIRKGYQQAPRTTFSWDDWHQFDVSPRGCYGIFFDEARHFNASEISPPPTRSPSTSLPTRSPSTSLPTRCPTTTLPTRYPTTTKPSLFPTTSIPSKSPTSPSNRPSVSPSKKPSVSPSISPSKSPSDSSASNAGNHPHMNDMVLATLVTLAIICFCFIVVVCCKVFCEEKQNRGWSFRSAEELNSWHHRLARPAEGGEGGLIWINRNPGRGDDLGITPRERKDSDGRLEGERKYSGPTGYSIVNQRQVEGLLNPGVVNLPENPSQRRRHGRVPSREIPPDWLKNSKIQ